MEEKLSLTCGRDGGLQNLEIHGLLTLLINEEAYGRVRVQVNALLVIYPKASSNNVVQIVGEQRQPRANPDPPKRR